MSRRWLGIGIAMSAAIVVLLVAWLGQRAPDQDLRPSPSPSVAVRSSSAPSFVVPLATPEAGSMVGPAILSMKKPGGHVIVVTGSSGCDGALEPSAKLVRWCALVLSPDPVTIAATGLTIADESTFEAIVARGLLMHDESVCDLACGVVSQLVRGASKAGPVLRD